MDANRKIKKLSDISEFQMIMYEEKTLYMNDNLGRLLKLMEANDISHNKSELFQCEKRGRNSVYLYKALWHFQIFEMDQERIEKFWRLILQKHYLGMVEETETIKQYFTDMQELAETDGILVLAKESYGNDSTLHYLYDKFEHIHGERSYLSWAFDEGKIKRYLKREEHDLIKKDLLAHKIYSSWQFIKYTEKNIDIVHYCADTINNLVDKMEMKTIRWQQDAT